MGQGAGVECGKADAYLASWHERMFKRKPTPDTAQEGDKRTAGAWAEKGKRLPKANDPI